MNYLITRTLKKKSFKNKKQILKRGKKTLNKRKIKKYKLKKRKNTKKKKYQKISRKKIGGGEGDTGIASPPSETQDTEINSDVDSEKKLDIKSDVEGSNTGGINESDDISKKEAIAVVSSIPSKSKITDIPKGFVDGVSEQYGPEIEKLKDQLKKITPKSYAKSKSY